MAARASSAASGSGPGDEEKKTFLTEPNLKGEDLTDDFPDYDEDMAPEEDNQDTAMLKKEHQMRIMDDALELMKREFAARMEEVARKEAKLAVEKAALDGMVEKFRDFIQENDAKKEKALAKAAEEEEAIRKLKAEEASWERQIEEAKRRRQALADLTQSLTPYYRFLAAVVADPTTEFADTADMLGRYARLDGTHRSQDETVKRKKEAVVEVRRQIARATEEGETRQLELSSKIEEGRKELEALAERGRELADERAGADDAARRLIVEESQVRMSAVNLFGRCRDSVLLTAGGGRAEDAAATGPGGAASGAKSKKATAKLLTQMHVAPPADGSRAELQRHLEDTLDVVGQRMADLVELERRYPAWAERKAREAREAARRAAELREHDVVAKQAKERALAGARERVADIRQQRARLADGSMVSGSEMLGGGASVMSGADSEAGVETEGGEPEDGTAVARHFAGNTYRVRLGGGAGAATGGGPASSLSPGGQGTGFSMPGALRS